MIKTILSLLILLLAVRAQAQFSMGSKSVPTAINGFSACREVRIDMTKVSRTVFPPVDLSGFPVLVDSKNLDPQFKADLRTVANGGVITSANGFDIVFYPDALGGAGGAKIDHEIDTYNAATGEFIAWVRRDLTDSLNALFWVCYGKAAITTDQGTTAAWHSSYAGVWHFVDNGKAVTLFDSTANSNIGTAVKVSAPITGKIGSAIHFQGEPNTSFVSIPNSVSLTMTTITVEAWYHADDILGGSIYNKKNSPDDDGEGVSFFIDPVNGVGVRLFAAVGSGSATVYENRAVMAGDTRYVVFVFRPSVHQLELYVNGALVTTYDFYPGGREVVSAAIIGGLFNGWIDELRVSNVARSLDWIKTNYDMQLNPGLMVSVGPRL